MNLQRFQAFNTTPTLTHRINFQSSPHISKIPDFEMKIQLQIRLFDFLLLYLFNLIFYFKLVIDWPFRNSLSADLISTNHWTNKPRKGDTTYYQGAQKFRFQNEWKKVYNWTDWNMKNNSKTNQSSKYTCLPISKGHSR